MGVPGWLKIWSNERSKSSAEKKLVRKLDFAVTAYCCVGFFFNFLDRHAFANAYVAGLKEDIRLKGNEYSFLLSMWTAGSVVGQIPHALIIQKLRPSIWLPLTLLCWSGLTISFAGCKTYSQLAAVRFLLGLVESSFNGGFMYILGSWFKPSEIALRTALFTSVGQVGSMFAGIMMTAMYRTMEGRAALAGWQWLFIINGLMGIPVGLAGFFILPDLPENTKAKYITEEERRLAISRLPPKRSNTHSIEIRSLSKRALLTPHLYVFSFFSVISAMLEAFAFQGLFLLWLKYNNSRFTQTQINTYPLGIQAVTIVAPIIAGIIIDKTGRRIPVAILGAAMQLVTASLLLVRDLPDAGIFTAHYLGGASFIVNPVMFSWATVVCQRIGDDAVRAVVLHSMTMCGQILYVFWGIILYPATDAPYWKKGSIAMIVAVFVYMGYLFVVRWVDRRTKIPDETDTNEERTEEHIAVKMATKEDPIRDHEARKTT